MPHMSTTYHITLVRNKQITVLRELKIHKCGIFNNILHIHV